MPAGIGDHDGPWDDIPSAANLSSERRLNVTVISPSAAAFSGTATSLIAPAHDGEVGILYGHAPMVVLLGEGVLRVRTDEGPRRFQVARGFMQVLDNTVAVLAEHLEPLGEA
ncbi:F0F1 ATP synthase subunit epsilon [Candidatus Palauibacter sp.]|uniref:F0F1 ATP synthase subunit epsilon n=1 Tax=Candidatus Palauibacter sp. TaxID=3101350 RepID=UPI003AF1FF3D